MRFLMATALLFTIACGGSSSGDDVVAAPPRRSPDRAYPLILSVSPSSVDVSDGHIRGAQRLEVTYSVENASKLTRLELEVYVPGVGRLQKADLDIPPDDAQQQYDFWLDAGARDLGPSVKFQVRCPSGDSDWVAIGYDTTTRDRKPGPLPWLATVNASHLASDSGVIPVTLRGRGFGRDCTVQASINGDTQDVRDVYIHGDDINGTIESSSLRFRTIGKRFLELKLIGYSTGYPVEHLTHVAFVE